MSATEMRTVATLAKINGITTMGGLIDFYKRMKQGNESVVETLARHTREVLGVE